MIELPNYNWFVTAADGRPASNTMTGSLGTEPDTGCLTRRTFNYKVFVSDVGKENVKLHAECWIQPPWNKGVLKENFESTEFECTQEGIETAAKWLSNKAKSHNII